MTKKASGGNIIFKTNFFYFSPYSKYAILNSLNKDINCKCLNHKIISTKVFRSL